ncbi:hypothetical protein ACJX0J_036346, partial [Zea mays]
SQQFLSLVMKMAQNVTHIGKLNSGKEMPISIVHLVSLVSLCICSVHVILFLSVCFQVPFGKKLWSQDATNISLSVCCIEKACLPIERQQNNTILGIPHVEIQLDL